MTMRSRWLLCLICCATVADSAAAECVTLVSTKPAQGQVVPSATITLATNDLAQVLHLYDAPGTDTFQLLVVAGGQTFIYQDGTVKESAGLPIIAGPATITLRAHASSLAACTLKVTRANELFTPGNAVVIPADSDGPVTIILESSADLVTWTPATPGTYGATTSKRFFRVRAQR